MYLLWIGAAAGLGLAVATVLTPGAQAVQPAMPSGTVAEVNGQAIPRSRFEDALRRASATPDGASPELKRQVLENLVDEELLVQHGIALKLPQSDPLVRRALLDAVLRVEDTASEVQDPTTEELTVFYQQVSDTFERPAALQLREVRVVSSSPEDDARAQAVVQRAASMLRSGMPLDHVCLVAQCSEEEPAVSSELTLLPELTVRLGQRNVEAVRGLKKGEVSEVLSDGRTHRVFQVVQARPAQVPPLAEVREEVVRRFRLSQRHANLQETLALLRESATIAIANPP